MTLERLPIDHSEDDGVVRDCYVVRNTENGMVGTYAITTHASGNVFCSRDYHYPVDADYVKQFLEPAYCEYTGCVSICDGSSLVRYEPDVEDRWRIAEMMAA